MNKFNKSRNYLPEEQDHAVTLIASLPIIYRQYSVGKTSLRHWIITRVSIRNYDSFVSTRSFYIRHRGIALSESLINYTGCIFHNGRDYFWSFSFDNICVSPLFISLQKHNFEVCTHIKTESSNRKTFLYFFNIINYEENYRGYRITAVIYSRRGNVSNYDYIKMIYVVKLLCFLFFYYFSAIPTHESSLATLQYNFLSKIF